MAYFAKNMKVKTIWREKSIWLVKEREPIYGIDGKWQVVTYSHHCKHMAYEFTIETYAKTYTIRCTADLVVKTDHGYKPIDKLKKDDGLYVRGVFIPQKYTAVKSISRKKCDYEDMYMLETAMDEYFVNDILVKNSDNGDRLHTTN